MTITVYTLSRIVRTPGTDLRFIWNDLYEETHEPEWRGYMYGVMGGVDWERYDNVGGRIRMVRQSVADEFVNVDGGTIEDAPTIEPEPEE